MHILLIELICDFQLSPKNKFSYAASITAVVAAAPTARSMGLGGMKIACYASAGTRLRVTTINSGIVSNQFALISRNWGSSLSGRQSGRKDSRKVV
jgi:hypothetical protein